jgi:UDP-GlcNAc:undecaprenyl-phosphate/decaprenyl-phosphate GlcNAc-1-phosphate transferase
MNLLVAGQLPVAAMAFVISALAMTLLVRAAPMLHLIDHPAGRKNHSHPVPVVGGLAVFLSLGVVTLLFDHSLLLYLGCAAIVVVVGVADDFMDMSPYVRFMAQIAAACAMILVGSTRLVHVGDLLGTGILGLSVLSFALTVFAVVGVINSINMLDGMDGLVGATTTIALFWYAAVAGLQNQVELLALALYTAAALLGFLLFNLRLPWQSRARAFLGDAGSLLLGFILSWLAVGLTQGAFSFPPICALWILLLPLADCVSILVRRIRARQSPFAPDNRHIHHYLLARGATASQALGILAALSTVCGAVGFFGWQLGVPQHYLFWAFFIGFFGYHIWIQRAWLAIDRRPAIATLKQGEQLPATSGR